jgi:hypothetical protein
MLKPATNPKSPSTDRRSGTDRRDVDAPPPGQRERRRGLEARKPEVVELDMSDSEWAALSGEPSVPAK